MQILERFNISKNPEITAQLEEYITFVARTGDSVYAWSLVKNLFREKLLTVITDFHNETPLKGEKQTLTTTNIQLTISNHYLFPDLPQYPNVDPFNYDTLKKILIERLESFSAAPFTIQRISELLSDPRKQYSRIDKFMRAVEKNILVVSTVPPGRTRSESENGDSLDSAMNGDFASEVNVDIDMEQDGAFTMTKTVAVTTHSKEQNHEVSTENQEKITIKKDASPSKDDGASTSAENEENKAMETEKEAEVSSTTVTIESSSSISITIIEPEIVVKEVEPVPEILVEENITVTEADAIKPVIVQEAAEVVSNDIVVEEVVSNEPIKPADNAILVDTSEIISETTPLAALENIVAIQTEPVVVVVEPVTPLIVVEPEPEKIEEIIAQEPEPLEEDEDETEVETKRLKISEDVPEEPPKLTEAVVVTEPPADEPLISVIQEKPELVEIPAAPVELIADQTDAVPTIEAAAIVETPEPIVEEKIDEPLPETAAVPIEIAEVPIEITPEPIVEAPVADMETVPSIAETNTMSLDEDEPPTLELEMTPIASKMDTDEAEAAPMDFEDDAEPMDQ